MTRFDNEKTQRCLTQLNDILAQETVFLKTGQTKRLEETYEEKLSLLQALEEQKKILRQRAKDAPQDKGDVTALVALGKTLDATLAEHSKHLIKARDVNRIVLEAISGALEEHFKEVSSYTKKGKDSQYVAKGESLVPPMRVNQTF